MAKKNFRSGGLPVTDLCGEAPKDFSEPPPKFSFISWLRKLWVTEPTKATKRKDKPISGSDRFDADCEEPITRNAVTPYNVYGCRPDWCECFHEVVEPIKPGTKLIAVIDLDLRALYFHVATWSAVAKPTFKWTILPYLQEDTDECWYRGALMVEEEHYEETNNWFESYSERIGKIDSPQPFPDLPTGVQIVGTGVDVKGNAYSRRDLDIPRQNMFEEWCWIIENCHGKIYHISGNWLFENNTEAVMFTLTTI